MEVRELIEGNSHMIKNYPTKVFIGNLRRCRIKSSFHQGPSTFISNKKKEKKIINKSLNNKSWVNALQEELYTAK